MTKRFYTILAVWADLLACAAAAAYWYISSYRPEIIIGNPNVETDPIGDPFFKSEELMRSTAYQEIGSFLAAGNTEKVNDIYLDLKGTYATGTPERDVIDLDHAFFTTFSYAKPLEGVEMLKSIVIDVSEYDPTTRALAIEALSRAVSTYESAEVTSAVFAGEPFSTKFSIASNSASAATIFLFEEAMKVRPTPLASARVAQEKARLLSTQKDVLSADEAQVLRDQFIDAMALADSSAEVIEGRTGFGDYLGIVNLAKGNAYALAFYGQMRESDKAQADAFFRKSIQLSQGTSQTFALYGYAIFLMRIEAPLADVESVIARLTQLPSHDRRLINEHFVNSYENTEAARHGSIIALMAYSPMFNTYVLNLTKNDVPSS